LAAGAAAVHDDVCAASLVPVYIVEDRDVAKRSSRAKALKDYFTYKAH
jgi:hypothetical protein